MSAPPATSGSTHATQPSRAAYNSGVNPPVCMILMRGSAVTRRSQSCVVPRASTAAPCSTSSRIISGCFCAAAHISAVCPPKRFARVHARAVLEQQPRRLDAARARDDHQRRLPFRVRRLDVGARLEQRADDLGVGLDGRRRKRRNAIVVGRIGIRAAREQRRHELAVALMRGPDQRRRAVRPARIDVGAVLERPQRRLALPELDELRQRLRRQARERSAKKRPTRHAN